MTTFKETGLSPQVLKAIDELGFITPTPIQCKTIPALLTSEKDLVALAQTGTGKTAAFGLPIVDQIQIGELHIQALVLCPTRELCIQITEDLKRYAKYRTGLEILPVYGGTEIRPQIKALKAGVQIVVGTPGRVNDLINKNILKPQSIKWMVLDEADEMLNMGFKEELDAIFQATPPGRQTLLFSATMPKEIERIANQYMRERDEISVGQKNASTLNVSHHYFLTHARDRYEALKRIADIYPGIYGIVFCRTRQETKDVADKLLADGYNAEALHGDLSQVQRDLVMGKFRTRLLQILVATDVAARGIDITDLSHVINYNLPDDSEVYIHRSGRTGRAGKLGISIALVHLKEKHKIRDIERMAKVKFERKMLPTGIEICHKQLFHMIEKVEHIDVNQEQIEPYMAEIYEKLAAIDRDDLIKRFVSAEFNSFLDYYKDAADLNVYEDESRVSRRNSSSSESSNGNMKRMFINIGKAKNLTPPVLFSLIEQFTGKKGIDIGKIEILRNFSFFEVEKEWEPQLMKAFKSASYLGERISIEPADQKQQESSSRPSNERRPYGGGNDNRSSDRSGDRKSSDRGDRSNVRSSDRSSDRGGSSSSSRPSGDKRKRFTR